MKSLRNKFRKKASLSDNIQPISIEKFTRTSDSIPGVSTEHDQSSPKPDKNNVSVSKNSSVDASSNTKNKSSTKKTILSLTPTSKRKRNYFSVSASSSPINSNKLKTPETTFKNGVFMTSFSSMQNLSQIDPTTKSDSAFSSMDPLPNNSNDLQNLSLSSASSSQGSSPDASVFSSPRPSNQFNFSPSEKRNSKRRSSKSGGDSLSDSQNSGFFKNLINHKKEKSPKLRQKSSKENFKALSRHSRSLENLNVDPNKTNQLLEKFKEHNEALEIEVRGKDEEVRMLNATIDQVNQTWEQKVQAMMKDLEKTKKHNDLLKRLQKENSNSSVNNNKTALRVPLNSKHKKSTTSLQQPKSMGSDEESVAGSVYSKITSPRMNRKGIREPTRRMGVAVRHGAKSDDIRQKLLRSLKTSPCLSQLSDGDISCIADVMKSKRIFVGERLMQEGIFGQAFYVLTDGECRIFKQNQEMNSIDFSNNGRALKQWEVFGEADVFYHTKRVWSCKCVRPGTVWYITREEFKSAIMQQDVLHRQRKEILTFLNKVNSFEKLNGYDLKMLATVSKIVRFAKGDYIFRQGSSLTSVYLLKEGEVTLTRIIDGSETRLETISAGQLLGVSTAATRHQKNALATGKEVVQCVAIPYKHFNKVRDQVNLLLSDVTLSKVNASLARQSYFEDGRESVSSEITGSSSGYGSDQSSPNPRRRNLKRYDQSHVLVFDKIANLLKNKKDTDFETVTKIGNGAFGSVTLAKIKKNDEHVFAVKKLSKHEVVASEQQQNVFSEKTIQMSTSHDCPFIVSLYSTFKDSRFVYFVMEFCPGGELFSLLSSARSFDDVTTRFYASCILEALTFLHSRKVVFRDLKPENVVLDKDGYCKLTDFGFAKTITKSSSLRTYTYCGTPEYMAPETILYHAQSFPVDIWALGVFIFEMLDGKAPFRDRSRVALADLILAGIEPMLKRSREAKRITSPAATSLIKELCKIRPEDRLGYGKGGISQVAKHSWFQKTNWEALRQRKATAPWIPRLAGLRDTKYFKTGSKFEQIHDVEEEFSGWDESF